MSEMWEDDDELSGDQEINENKKYFSFTLFNFLDSDSGSGGDYTSLQMFLAAVGLHVCQGED